MDDSLLEAGRGLWLADNLSHDPSFLTPALGSSCMGVKHAAKHGSRAVAPRAPLLHSSNGAPEWWYSVSGLTLARLEAAAWDCVERLTPRDGGKRNLVLARLQAIGWQAVPGSSMLLFGSTACELHADGADLDVTLIQPHAQRPPSYLEQQALVRHLAVAFQSFQASGEFTHVEAVDRARVPILKLQHAASGLQCDVSIGNDLAVQKTRLLHAYVQLDPRVRPLCLIVKHCAPPPPPTRINNCRPH